MELKNKKRFSEEDVFFLNKIMKNLGFENCSVGGQEYYVFSAYADMYVLERRKDNTGLSWYSFYSWQYKENGSQKVAYCENVKFVVAIERVAKILTHLIQKREVQCDEEFWLIIKTYQWTSDFTAKALNKTYEDFQKDLETKRWYEKWRESNDTF